LEGFCLIFGVIAQTLLTKLFGEINFIAFAGEAKMHHFCYGSNVFDFVPNSW
jgi:hypothetical protein